MKNRCSKPRPKSKPIEVTISVRDNRLVWNPDPLTLNIERKQEAVWRCNDGRLEIRFAPKRTPFRADRFATVQGGGCWSGLPVKAQKTPYKYFILVTTAQNKLLTAEAKVTVVEKAPGNAPKAK